MDISWCDTREPMVSIWRMTFVWFCTPSFCSCPGLREHNQCQPWSSESCHNQGQLRSQISMALCQKNVQNNQSNSSSSRPGTISQLSFSIPWANATLTAQVDDTDIWALCSWSPSCAATAACDTWVCWPIYPCPILLIQGKWWLDLFKSHVWRLGMGSSGTIFSVVFGGYLTVLNVLPRIR